MVASGAIADARLVSGADDAENHWPTAGVSNSYADGNI